MRKVTQIICGAFENRRTAKLGNTQTDGEALYLHGNKIAEWREGVLWITNAGWTSNTKKERLNGLRGVSISQKDFTWYLNGKAWDGSWIAPAEIVATCPACGGAMHAEPVRNALSRYARGVYICSPCGSREAFDGDFWKGQR